MYFQLRVFRLLLLSTVAAMWSSFAAGQTPPSPVTTGKAVCENCAARSAVPPVQTERRIALVIGNGSYEASGSLANPPNDAQDISAVLTAIGFEVATVIDATKRDMDRALQRFARQAVSADAALFFYAGHAMQYQGRNLLMPTDGKLEDEFSVPYETVDLEAVRDALDHTRGIKIIILDACRDNPIANRLRSIGGASRGGPATRGLAPIDKAQGMVVAYATAAGEVADDGLSRNSPFTTALLRQLQQPGLEIGIMFRRVASDVNAQTGGHQRPETHISLLSEYYLNQGDRVAWDSIKDRGDTAALRDFLDKYPLSPLVLPARDRLAVLEREDLARRQQELREQEQRVRDDQLAAQKRTEEERKRRDEASRREEQQRQEDQKREQEALIRQQEEQKHEEEALIRLQDEQWRHQEEQKREQEALIRQQEERNRPPGPVTEPVARPALIDRPAEALPKPGEVVRDCSACPELVVVPAGEFLMGSPSERDAGNRTDATNEGPQHKVLIGQPMAVGRFEVTRDQFETFVRASGYRIGDRCYTLEKNTPQERIGRSFRNPGFPQDGTHPAVCINWSDAKAYVAWLSQATGKAYRLLSEAEWEYAARAGSALRHGFARDAADACKFANGADQSARLAMLPGNYAYMNCSDGHAYTAPVGSYAANAFGLFDLLGNAWEWTEDCFYDDYVAAPSDGSARSAVSCAGRTVRGGSWFSSGESLRPSVRAKAAANNRYDDIGFRVARPLSPANAGFNTARQ